MATSLYRVTFKVDYSTSIRTVHLHYPSESEAREALYRQCTVPRDKDIIILGIELV